ncbi:glycosyltransferase family 2 protein [Oleidesulfovibrio sp.]|uniref:glycosyltransferase family 2 protein n=1 Tax=Oleidesulfovibrio sp. TaxID=2909707 RepID=UPI003A86215A
MEPVVSVIMPVYNTEAYLAEAVQSVLDQDFTDFELLVLDDGSPGDAGAVLSQFDDARIRYLRHENMGPGYTRNRGIRESLGRYVAFLDSDDAWMPDKLSRQVALLDAQPEYDVVYTQRRNMDAESRPVHGHTPRLHSGFVLNELYVDSFVCMSSTMVRRSIFEDVGYIDETLRMSEDFEFWLRVACRHRFLAIDEPLVRYRVHGGQVSQKVAERVRVVWEIRADFNKQSGQFVSRRARMRARALHFAGRATRAAAAGNKGQAVWLYLRALAHYPPDEPAWRGLIKTLLPQVMLRSMRKTLKREGSV